MAHDLSRTVRAAPTGRWYSDAAARSLMRAASATGRIWSARRGAGRCLDLAPSAVLVPGATPLPPPKSQPGGRRLPATRARGLPDLLSSVQRPPYGEGPNPAGR